MGCGKWLIENLELDENTSLEMRIDEQNLCFYSMLYAMARNPNPGICKHR
jgi:hypothetical protein